MNISQKDLNQQSTSYEIQYQKLKTKYQNQIKKNTNLLKMNTNLMRQNQLYQNSLTLLKKWSIGFLAQISDDSQIADQSLDVEQGQAFIQTLTQQIQRKLINYSQNYQNFKFNTQTQINPSLTNQKFLTQQCQKCYTNSRRQQQKQCQNCVRWKQLYIKQTSQTSRLQKIIDQSQFMRDNRQINMVKLKDDISKLLQDYWKLYRKQFNVQNMLMEKKSEQRINSNTKITSQQTVRLSGDKNKVKQNQSKNKKINNGISSAFSKQKTSRSNKYAIQLKGINNQKQQRFAIQKQKQQQKENSQISQNLLKYNQILNSYSQCIKQLEEENSFIKQHLKQYNQLVNIYRQKERNRILGR